MSLHRSSKLQRNLSLLLWQAGLLVWLCVCIGAPSLARAQQQCAKPDILLIVDMSGSMNGSVSGSGGLTKMQALRLAYRDILQKFGSAARFGLITFQSQRGGTPSQPFNCNTCTGCAVCAGEASLVKIRVPVADNTAQQCIKTLEGLSPDGCTSTYPALELAESHFKTKIIPKDNEPSRPRVVILMTDGLPNVGCPNNSWACERPDDVSGCGFFLAQKAQQMRNIAVNGKGYDVKTYVIGFGAPVTSTGYACENRRCPVQSKNIDTSLLNSIAKAGGTQKYYQTNDVAQLKAALQSIIKQTSQQEVCDGKDNDCDGQTDEDLKRTCEGFCAIGESICSGGTWGPCSAAPERREEVCNNVDDDCDGEVDEELDQECTPSCGKGTRRCIDGVWSKCVTDVSKNPPEVCNGKDDNCDGQVDEKLSQTCESKCAKGTKDCIGGTWSSCSAPLPQEEVCDGVDNDCDGTIDEDTSCKGKCVDGLCLAACADGCPEGFTCGSDTFCQPKPCEPSCAAGKICQGGTCVPEDCTAPGGGCGPQKVCLNKKCSKDPCLGISCAEGRFCSDGMCRLSCVGVACQVGSICQAGRCEPDTCYGVACNDKQVCRGGKCISYTCTSTSDCEHGTVCVNERCTTQRCARTKCPEGSSCMNGDCYPPEHKYAKPTELPPVSGGFGSSSPNASACSCSSTSGSVPLSPFLFVLLWMLVGMRKPAGGRFVG